MLKVPRGGTFNIFSGFDSGAKYCKLITSPRPSDLKALNISHSLIFGIFKYIVFMNLIEN